MFQSKEIKEKLNKIDADQRSIYDLAKKEGRSTLNDEESAKFDKLQDEYSASKRELQRVEEIEAREAFEAEEIEKQEELNKEDKRTDEEKYAGAFEKYIRSGFENLSKDERSVLKRAQSTTNSAGGFLIPQGFSGEVERSMKDFSGMLQVSRIVPTSSVGQIDWPTVDDTANKGRLISEAGDSSSGTTDITFANKQLDAYKYTSDLLLVNAELIEDEAIGIESLLSSLLAERLGRIANEHLTVGTGSSQPNGVVTAAAAGHTAAAAAAISRDDLVELVHSVNSVYRPNASFMFNDSTLKEIKKLSFGSADDRPLYIGGDARNGNPATIEGYNFVINDDMADIATTAVSALFGDFSKYVVRQVRGISVKRADERYIESDQVAFVGFARWDGELLNTAAVKKLTHP